MLSSVMKNKKGVSVVIGYILLMSVSIVMSIVVYQWLKTYVPKEALNCPDGTSLFIKNIVCEGGTLTLTIKNNGRFGIAGYFIHASTSSNPDAVATIDLSSNYMGDEDNIDGSSIRFLISAGEDNSLIPEITQEHKFDVSTISGTLSKIELIPIRIQTSDNMRRVVSCSDAKIETTVTCN